MKKKVLRLFSVILTVTLLSSAVIGESAWAVLSEVNAPSQVTTFTSTSNFDKEYVHAYVQDDTVLKVIYQTPLETSQFNLSLYRVGANSGNQNLNILVEPTVKVAYDGSATYGFTYYMDMETLNIANGYYNLYIRRYATMEDALTGTYGTAGILYKNMEIKVTNGKVRILRYKDVVEYNRSIQKIGEAYSLDKYLDNSLQDIRFVLRNPATNVYDTITDYKASYIKTVSDRVTAGASSDYDKLLKIYEYTAKNFYYDSVAFSTHSYQYANPYDNIYNFEQGLSSSNSVYGKVHTTCQGFSAIFLALARAQNIPTRFVYGHRLAVPSNDWLTENNIDVRDHWWVESYTNGRWIFIDPTVGTTNKYNKTTGKWTYNGLTNYTYFDPSEDQIATSHVYMNIYPDYRYGKYLDNPYEVETLSAFLNQTSGTSYKTNGALLNSSYDISNKETWGDGTKSHFMTDGAGNTAQIQWSSKGFEGKMNLSGFTKMTLLSSHGNKLTDVDLSGDTQLKNVYLYSNKLQSLNLSDCPRLSYVRVQNNPMKSLVMDVNGRNRTFTCGDNGTFYFTYDKRYTTTSFSLYSKPDIGYKLEGVYSTGTGNKLSSKATWHFTPQASGYSIRFALNPDSYKYYLTPGESRSSRVPYIQAAAKRLNALGYYNPQSGYDYVYGTSVAAVGTEASYTDAIKEAVTKFQVMHDINNTGNIDSETWSALFNNSALSMVSDDQYQQVLADYEVRKAAKAQAKADMKLVSVKASSTVEKGAIRLSWQVNINQPADVVDSLAGQGVTSPSTQIVPDGYELWKSSSSKTSGYTLLRDTTGFKFKNTSNVKKGTRYYYKVRAYKKVGTTKIYSDWSNVTYRTAK